VISLILLLILGLLKDLDIKINSDSDLRLILSLGSIYLSFKLEPTKPTNDINVSKCVDSIKVDPNGYTSRDFKKKNNMEMVTLRKQGAKFKFIVKEGKPDVLHHIVLFIFLDRKGLPRPQKSKILILFKLSYSYIETSQFTSLNI
jgi:hypothetical protein